MKRSILTLPAKFINSHSLVVISSRRIMLPDLSLPFSLSLFLFGGNKAIIYPFFHFLFFLSPLLCYIHSFQQQAEESKGRFYKKCNAILMIMMTSVWSRVNLQEIIKKLRSHLILSLAICRWWSYCNSFTVIIYT